MAEKGLRQQIEEFNEEIHAFELRHKIKLLNDLNNLCEEIKNNTKFGKENDILLDDFEQWAESCVDNMLQAETQEELDAYKDVFIESLSYLRERLSIAKLRPAQQPVQACLSFMTELCSRINFVDLPLSDDLVDKARESMGKHINACESQYQEILKRRSVDILMLLIYDGNRAGFDRQKELVLDNIKAHALIQPNIFEVHRLMGICDKEVDAICEARKTYLPKDENLVHYLKDYAWMTLGIGILITALVFSVLLPELLIPILILGGGVLAYSVVDFVKESSEKIAEFHYGRLGEKTLKPPSKISKVIKGLTWMGSGLGFGLAIVGLIAVIPGLVMPPLIPIIMATAAIAITVTLAAQVGYQHYKAVKKIKSGIRKSKQWKKKLKADLKAANRMTPGLKDEKSSVFKRLLKSKIQKEKILTKSANDQSIKVTEKSKEKEVESAAKKVVDKSENESDVKPTLKFR